MQIDTFILGDFATNCYLLRLSAQAKECLIIDPGFYPQELMDFIQDNALLPEKIILTHGHCDHIAGIMTVKEKFKSLPVSIGQADAEMILNPQLNLSLMTGDPFTIEPADNLLREGDLVELGDLTLEVLETPGHSPGCISFYCRREGIVFSGDTLFAGSIGRYDFPGSSLKSLLDSIRNKLLVLPEETRVLAGHGPQTTIGIEKKMNTFFQ
ncbi:MAG: MBL fold metallo-hydrolase [Sedimentisphaerales bacterium]|nr:MBL fold metallo-hydrolase [Sedimentisphaerales bacterium]